MCRLDEKESCSCSGNEDMNKKNKKTSQMSSSFLSKLTQHELKKKNIKNPMICLVPKY